ncbi:uncharacterized protein STEHIDRAFT_159734 [Stereum hirsutum FP-91666 SS1]|uniref:uncharacterized protein n=1 Tax=Stereum hirsutum (strain FP-91666) TaxID=721885 RepID=UPI00044497CF|nr:uncharacterized protein STEHIDRAFT_159734 [Stereum hirsutum FP-91666 SS1]EIM84141.1 hypothetical protein STEHIDRAFT_159734 [Stereum hirsutum FP-91666 SS1]
MSSQLTDMNQNQPTFGSTRSRKRLGIMVWTRIRNIGVKKSPSRNSGPEVLNSMSTAADGESVPKHGLALDEPATGGSIIDRVAVRLKMALLKLRTRVQSPTTHVSTSEALSIAAGLLKEVATMTQNAPYIQTLSSLITHIVQVNDEIDLLKSKRGLLRGNVLLLREIIEDVEERLGPDVDLPMDTQKSFRMLESVLNEVVLVLEKCFSTKKGKLLFARKKMLKDIEHCDAELKVALQCFNTKLQITQCLDNKRIETKVDNVVEAVEKCKKVQRSHM